MENKYCPFCGQETLYHIEDCESSEGEHKSSWSCSCTNMVVYIVEFE